MSISPERILYEDGQVLAVNKLSGELVVKGKGRIDRLPLLDFLKKDRPGLHPLHRLDFETSGVVLFAKNRAVLAMFMDDQTLMERKTYRALVAGVPKRKQGSIDFPLPARMGGMVDAHTEYTVLQAFEHCALVEAVITTGRHHQIRRHFAKIGHPLLLDEEYGDLRVNQKVARKLKYRRFFLHAAAIDLKHPVTGKAMKIEAPMPKTFESVLSKLKL